MASYAKLSNSAYLREPTENNSVLCVLNHSLATYLSLYHRIMKVRGLTLVTFSNWWRPTSKVMVVNNRSPLVTYLFYCSKVDLYRGTSLKSPAGIRAYSRNFTSNDWLPWMTLRPERCIRASSGTWSVQSTMYSRKPAGTWITFLGSRSDPAWDPPTRWKTYTKFTFRVTLMRVSPSVKYTDSPTPIHSCRSPSSFWQPTLRARRHPKWMSRHQYHSAGSHERCLSSRKP